ncbi:hypothetical protein HOG21_02515, partial [bacterium]|nr:hypothetical protein [bacterium]
MLVLSVKSVHHIILESVQKFALVATKVHPPQSVVMSQYTSNHVPLFSGYIVYIQSTNVESFNNKSEHDLGN